MSDKLGRNDLCWCGSGRKYKKCHALIDEQAETYRLKGYEVPRRKLLKAKQQIEGIRKSSKLNIAVLDFIREYVTHGVTTEELDRLIFEKTKEFGGVPADLNYEGYPKSVCISVDDVVCHGIPRMSYVK